MLPLRHHFNNTKMSNCQKPHHSQTIRSACDLCTTPANVLVIRRGFSCGLRLDDAANTNTTEEHREKLESPQEQYTEGGAKEKATYRLSHSLEGGKWDKTTETGLDASTSALQLFSTACFPPWAQTLRGQVTPAHLDGEVSWWHFWTFQLKLPEQK